MTAAAIIYAAKSTEDVHGSIPTQIEDCEALVEREGGTVAATYADEAASGWSGNRGPELERAMAHAAELSPSWLVVQHTDRLARGDGVKSRHLIELILWGMKAGVTIRSVQDDTSGENLIMAAVMGERNQEDSKRKSAAVKAGMKRRRKAGKHHGGPRPYGYEHRDGKLSVVEAEAVIVRRIFAEYVAGVSQLGITRNLAADGIPTIRGGKWHQGTVRAILANPVYVGQVGDVKGEHEAILDEDTWAKAEQLRAARTRTCGRGRPPAGQHLFRKGMLRCECGEALVPRTDGDYQVYRCYGRHRDRASCAMPPIRRELIDSAVYRYFEQVGLDVEATKRQFAEERDRKLAEIRALREEAEYQLTRAQESRERLERDYLDDKLGALLFERLMARVEGDHAAAEAEVERLRASEGDQVEAEPLADVESEVLKGLANIRRAIAGEVKDAEGVDAVRAALSRLFDRFVVHPAKNASYGRKRREDPKPEGPAIAPLVDIGDAFIVEVWVRERVLEGYDERLTPILRREPLARAENNYADSLTT